jgi:2-keto-4-pentenoate hydratase/2-oxohepta-3-ene-1,7-dioic acid hydratase in catechol pathway
MTLEPGDVIAMGTPEGVGFARGRNLRAGDHLRAEIDGLGHLDTFIGDGA